MFFKILGYSLAGAGGVILGKSGFDITTWQYWAIVFCLIFGSDMTRWE